MPTKRKASIKNPKVPAVKKLKTDITIKTGKFSKKAVYTIDKGAGVQFIGGNVVDDFDCMMNQTNIDGSNNKFYVLQMILHSGNYFVWTRWGRAGESGKGMKFGPFKTKKQAEQSFDKMFHDKTKNDWINRNNFKAVKGKYILIEKGNDDIDDLGSKDVISVVKNSNINHKYDPSLLDESTQFLIDLIYDTEMFNDALAQLKLDTIKLPLVELNQPQLSKGFEVLENLLNAISNKQRKSIYQLSSEFYTIIPHNFGQSAPPTITTLDQVREKLDMLLVLMDIESTQALLYGPRKRKQWQLNQHPLDDKYDRLDIGLIPLDRDRKEFNIIHEYAENSKGIPFTIVNIWEVFRRPEYKRFKIHRDITNRRLLWYATNIASVAAILKCGLRTLSHSGGPMGKGIYFRSESGTASLSVRCNRSNLGIMFLNEVALGNEKHIFEEGMTIVEPPLGFQSIVTQGKTEPDPNYDKHIILDKKEIIVPVGKPVKSKFSTEFLQNEYVIYKESQCCIRYMVLCKF